jgi:glycosyltransferase involved in cell wall biosynthesis
VKTVIVDWLGRGGIAETTIAWGRELTADGHEVTVVTRPGREIASQGFTVVEAPAGRGRMGSHRKLATAAATTSRELQPANVLIQNYVLPPLEGAAYRAAVDTGARIVVAIHDHRLHSVAAGTAFGLRRHLLLADTLLAHSPFVADAVKARVGCDVELLPLPLPLGLLDQVENDVANLDGPGLLAVHFGVLKRGYKGTKTVLELARRGVPGWRFAVMGNGAPAEAPGVRSLPGFVDAGVLVAAVRASAVTLLPYKVASQSAAVVFAQAMASVPIATAVGGIPSQIVDGVTGRLMSPDAPVEAWAAVLAELADDDVRCALADAARAKASADHREFAARARALLA